MHEAREPPWLPSDQSAIRQGDIEFQNRAAALVFQCNLYLIRVDIHVLADHLNQFLLQGWQVVRGAALATLVRLLDTTYARVGNDVYARENGSYGLTTLRNRHAGSAGGANAINAIAVIISFTQ